ncbi:MAG: 50S ribosomal protein L22 [Methanomassiliicoccales archaeon]|nr:50S ribosomal protein L22 [Methanomassiliicoccales archaeon]
MVGYTAEADPDITSRAIGKELPISPKHAREICNMLRGKTTVEAAQILEEIIELKRPVSMKRFNKGISHKKGVGPGRYPRKAAKEILKVLEGAKHNAEYKGLDPENMRVKVITANLGRTIKGYMPRAYGRATQWNQQTTNIEIILEEMK